MHNHGTQKSANACSYLCAPNYRDKGYYQAHGHYQDEAPANGCGACKEQQQRAEDKRRAEEKWHRG